MKIEIRSKGLRLTAAERAHAERRVSFLLARFGERIDRVILCCSKDDTPDGGCYRRCQIEVSIRPRAVRVEHADPDVLVAFDHAARLAARSVARALARERAAEAGEAPLEKAPRKRALAKKKR